MKKSLLLLTTENDISIPLFYDNHIKKIFTVDIEIFSDELNPDILNNFDYVYIRDPFTGKIHSEKVKDLLDRIFSKKLKCNFIDNLEKTEDIFIEDKWIQYELFKDFMAETRLYEGNLDPVNEIAKKRISSRSQGIAFTKDDIEPNENYIVQKKLNIKQEFRVYSIKDQILQKCAVKISKSPTSKAKLSSSIEIPKEIYDFSVKIISKVNFDLTGLDIAIDQDEKIFLIELNRSPQFIGFYRESGTNLALELLKHYE